MPHCIKINKNPRPKDVVLLWAPHPPSFARRSMKDTKGGDNGRFCPDAFLIGTRPSIKNKPSGKPWFLVGPASPRVVLKTENYEEQAETAHVWFHRNQTYFCELRRTNQSYSANKSKHEHPFLLPLAIPNLAKTRLLVYFSLNRITWTVEF